MGQSVLVKVTIVGQSGDDWLTFRRFGLATKCSSPVGAAGCPLWVTCGRRRGKSFFDVGAALVGCGHVSGLLRGARALRLSARTGLGNRQPNNGACHFVHNSMFRLAARRASARIARRNFHERRPGRPRNHLDYLNGRKSSGDIDPAIATPARAGQWRREAREDHQRAPKILAQ